MTKNKYLSIYLFIYLFIWVALTAIFYNKYEVVGATVENMAWGNHLSFMYDKHPGLGAFVLKTFSLISFGDATLAGVLSSGLAVLVSLIYTYKISRQYFSRQEASLLTILTTLSAFYLFRYFLSFDQNLILLPFWVMVSYYFVAIQNNDTYKNWILLSVATAIGFYAKFEILLLAGTLFLYIICTFKKEYLPKLIIAAAIFVILIVPAIICIINLHFSPIIYAFNSASGTAVKVSSDSVFMKIMIAQLHNLLPILFVLVPVSILFILNKIRILKVDKQNTIFVNIKHPLVVVWLYPFAIFAVLQSYYGELPGGWALAIMSLFMPAIYKLLNFKEVKVMNIKKVVVIFALLQLITFSVYNIAKYYNDVFLSDNTGNGLAVKADDLWAKYYNYPMPYTSDVFIAGFSSYKPMFIRKIEQLPKGAKAIITATGCSGILEQGFEILHKECVSVSTIGKNHNINSQVSIFIIQK